MPKVGFSNRSFSCFLRLKRFCALVCFVESPTPPVDKITNAQDPWELEELEQEASDHLNVSMLFYAATIGLWCAATVLVYGPFLNETRFGHPSLTSWI